MKLDQVVILLMCILAWFAPFNVLGGGQNKICPKCKYMTDSNTTTCPDDDTPLQPLSRWQDSHKVDEVNNAYQPQREELTRSQLQAFLNAEDRAQRIFSILHPHGRAKSIEVHSISLNRDTNGKILSLRTKFTLYWDTPLTADGWTKVDARYDGEVKRWTGFSVLQTNGTTNDDVAKLLAAGMKALIGIALNPPDR